MIPVFPESPKRIYEWARHTMPSVADSLQIASHTDEQGNVLLMLCLESSRGVVHYPVGRKDLEAALQALAAAPAPAPAAQDEPDVG